MNNYPKTVRIVGFYFIINMRKVYKLLIVSTAHKSITLRMIFLLSDSGQVLKHNYLATK